MDHAARRARISGVAAAAATLLSSLATAQIPCGYEVTAVIRGPWCGDFYGYPPTIPQDIGENGEVVGYYNHCTIGPSVPFIWTAGKGLVALDVPAGFSSGTVRGVDDQTGWLVGSTDGPGTDGPYATVWQNGQPVVLGTMPGGNFSSAFASAHGRVAGRWGNDSTGDPGLQAFLWENGVMLDLASDLGTPAAEARGVNEAGQVVGWMGTGTSSDARAFIWEEGEVTDLGPIPGGFTSEARAINDARTVVGVGRVIDPETGEVAVRTFIWAQATMTNLGTLPGFPLSAGLDINDSGVLVGRLWGGIGNAGFVWYDGEMVDLNTLIPPDAGVSVVIPYGINNAGQIAAYGQDEERDVVGLLLTPIPQRLGDLTCDGSVSEDDFWLLLDAWGPCPEPCPPSCAADLDGDCRVGVVDFLIMLANWG